MRMPLAARGILSSAKAEKISNIMTTDTTAQPKVIGKVTHFYGRINVATVKFEEDLPLGARVRFKGAHANFVEPVTSMEYDHKPVVKAKKGQEIGVKVEGRVHEGDLVLAED